MLHVLNAFSLLATLGLTALGLWIVFGLMNVVNVAHGEFAMLGAYSMVVLTGLGSIIGWPWPLRRSCSWWSARYAS